MNGLEKVNQLQEFDFFNTVYTDMIILNLNVLEVQKCIFKKMQRLEKPFESASDGDKDQTRPKHYSPVIKKSTVEINLTWHPQSLPAGL